MLTNEQIEKLFERWYDSRKRHHMPPGSFESYLAGWIAAIKSQAKQKENKNENA